MQTTQHIPTTAEQHIPTTADFLDELRTILKVNSDYAAGLAIGINHRQTISRYRKLHGTFDDSLCPKVAELTGHNLEFVLACMRHQREKNDQLRAAWERIATMTAGIAATVFIALVLPFIPLSPACINGVCEVKAEALYIMSNSFWIYGIAAALIAALIFAAPRYTPTQKQQAK